MRNTVIPAQITTVEDKIAGNLNLTQIFILMVPIFWTTFLFAFLPPTMKLVMYKLPLIISVFVACLILSIRIKGRVVLNWLFILFKFNSRPGFYVFNKNDTYLRNVDMPLLDNKKLVKATKRIKVLKNEVDELAEAESVKFLHAIANQNTSLSFKLGKQGGLHVAFEQIKK